jgi:hypothetical protein
LKNPLACVSLWRYSRAVYTQWHDIPPRNESLLPKNHFWIFQPVVAVLISFECGSQQFFSWMTFVQHEKKKKKSRAMLCATSIKSVEIKNERDWKL